MSSESNIYVFSDNPEASKQCKGLPVTCFEYKPETVNSSIYQILTWFGDSKSTDEVSVEKVLGGVYKKAAKNLEQKFYLVFDVYGLEEIENNFDYWDVLQKQPNIKVYRFSFHKELMKDDVHSLAAILNELCPECTPQHTADDSEKDQEPDKQAPRRKTQAPENNQFNAALLQNLKNFAEAIKQINAKVETLSQDVETVKTIVSKKSNIDETNLQLRQELTEKVQHASAEMSKAKRSEKQWVQCTSSFLDSLAAEASNPDLSEDMRYMAERYSKTLLRYLEPLQFEKIELTVGDNCNPCSEIQVRYSETETAPQEEPLKILEIQEYGYKYQGVVVKPAKVIVPQPVQTTNVKEETIEIVENDVNNKSAEK